MKQFKFQKTYSFDERSKEARQIREKYPDRIPFIIEVSNNSGLPELDKAKYLVPKDLSIGQFLFVIRKRLRVPPEKAVVLFIEGKLPPTNALLSEIDSHNKSSDGFVYGLICSENYFG